MLLLTGSRALHAYGRLKDREPLDWDFITDGPSYTKKIDGVLIEVSGIDKPENKTNCNIIEYCKTNYTHLLEIETPIGLALVSPLPVLKVLKLSCCPFLHKAKHTWDLQQLEDIKLTSELKTILVDRIIEVSTRVESTKDKFFNKYKIERTVHHDQLHLLINPEPTYLKAQHNEVEMSEAKFMSLSNIDKANIIREEAFVLAMERFLLPKLQHYYVLKMILYHKFNEFKSSGSVPYRTISKLSYPGLLKDHPDWIANWALQNNNIVMDGLEQWWYIQFHKVKLFLKGYIDEIKSSKKINENGN